MHIPDIDTTGMTPAEILRKHNEWRRDGEGGMVHPKEMSRNQREGRYAGWAFGTHKRMTGVECFKLGSLRNCYASLSRSNRKLKIMYPGEFK